MKAKTIRSICRKKHAAWVKSIEDKTVQELARKNTIITGGAIASMLLSEEVNDYDLYFTDKKTVEAIANYYVSKFPSKEHDIRVIDEHGRIKIVVKSAGIAGDKQTGTYKYFEGDPDPDGLEGEEYVKDAASVARDKRGIEKGTFTPVFLSSNAITLTDSIQLIIRFYGDADEIHKNFDFVHCTNYWQSGTDERLELRKDALEALLARDLRYVGSKYPICSAIRTRKFLNRGWRINAGQYLKMAFQISELDLRDVKVLEEQLVGVDVAYFNQLISCLKSANTTHVDGTYLMELVDEIF
jgi:hypothetical protein